VDKTEVTPTIGTDAAKPPQQAECGDNTLTKNQTYTCISIFVAHSTMSTQAARTMEFFASMKYFTGIDDDAQATAFLKDTMTIGDLVKELEAQPPTGPSLKDLSSDLKREHFEAFTDALSGAGLQLRDGLDCASKVKTIRFHVKKIVFDAAFYKKHNLPLPADGFGLGGIEEIKAFAVPEILPKLIDGKMHDVMYGL
jgi:hypothetical protein